MMLSTLTSMLRDEEGATMVEYGLLVALIAMVALVAVQALGTHVSSLFSTVAQSI
jgi:pilus assembly protein Flp/PilA